MATLALRSCLRSPTRVRSTGRLARSAAAALAVLLVLGLPAAAWALDITLVSSDRSVFAAGTSICPGCGPNGEDEEFSNSDGEQSNAFGIFDEFVASVGSAASQQSVVSASQLSGEGDLGLGTSVLSNAYSRLTVVFQVPVTGTYSVLGELEAELVNAFASISLESTSGSIFDRQASGLGTDVFTETFELTAGETYTLRADATGDDFGAFLENARWAFQLTPEPSTALLVGLGLCALAGRPRGRRR